MLDLETLSSKSDAAIISIGVARFDSGGVLDTEGWALDDSQVFGHIDPQTVYWWMKQSDAAKAYSFSGKAKPLDVAQGLIKFLGGCTELWANDPDFDVVIIRNWWDHWQNIYPQMGKFPVSFRASRSCRTLRALAPDCDVSMCYTGVAHNPVEDAAMQARAVIRQRKHLLAGRTPL